MIREDFFKDLSGIVIYHRKKSGLNRLELARIAGVGKTVVYDVERGKTTVRLDTIIKILSVLNLNIEITGPLMKAYRESLHEKG
jgi:HTH-type transcriptional regulator / antitoxin HipB